MPVIKLLKKILTWPLYRIWHFQYRFRPNFEPTELPEMHPSPLEGFANKPFYYVNEDIVFFIKSDFPFILTLEKSTDPFVYTTVKQVEFESPVAQNSGFNKDMSVNWDETLRIATSGFETGYYRATLQNALYKDHKFYISFIVAKKDKNADVLVIAPVSTWLAYNPYGGKSAYKNIADSKNVHFLSTQRPNTALQYKPEGENIHDMNVEMNIFNFFNKKYNTSVIPDYLLEKEEIFNSKTSIFVLAYHCEYFSAKSYKNLRLLINKHGRSLISLGGNQVYWKVVHKDNYRSMEIRKDHTWFDGSFEEGSMFRQGIYPEVDLLGVRFSDSGTGTYAPYQIMNASHWILNNLNVSNGFLFGMSGINSLPICGDETDKIENPDDTKVVLIAKGLNCEEQGTKIIYPDHRYNWNSSGGGCITVKELSASNAVLSTGSIQSGSGLGTDPVFTGIIVNFINRYLNK